MNDQAFKVWLVDVNAWSKTTDSLLFSWDAPPLSNDDAVKGPAEDSATVVAAVPTSPETPSVCAASADASIEGRNEVADPANPPVVGAHAATSSPSSSDAPPAASLVSSAPLDDAELRLVAASDGGAVRASPMAEYRAPLEMHLFAQVGPFSTAKHAQMPVLLLFWHVYAPTFDSNSFEMTSFFSSSG